ncbi:MAG: antirepressor regulating drug resistance protein [Chthonomonadaceae bacterium]|nr:antirepressor regulating drug resistance protein [Chthonomonadaceae bacterium]
MRNSIAPIRVSLLAMALATPLTAPILAHAQERPQQNAPAMRRISLELQDADIRVALQQIFNAAKVSYTVDPSVKGTVTASFSEIPLQTVLEMLLKYAPAPLTYRLENGVYSILPREAEEAVALPNMPKREISMKAEFVLMAGKGNKTSKSVVSMLGRTASEGTVKLQTTTGGKTSPDAALVVSSGDYNMTLKPTVNGDGSIQVDADVTLDITYRLPGDTGFQHLHNKLAGSGRYLSGDTMVFSSTVLKSKDGKSQEGDAELLIFLTPTLVQPRASKQPASGNIPPQNVIIRPADKQGSLHAVSDRKS